MNYIHATARAKGRQANNEIRILVFEEMGKISRLDVSFE